jgi:hypothetical protein
MVYSLLHYGNIVDGSGFGYFDNDFFGVYPVFLGKLYGFSGSEFIADNGKRVNVDKKVTGNIQPGKLTYNDFTAEKVKFNKAVASRCYLKEPLRRAQRAVTGAAD